MICPVDGLALNDPEFHQLDFDLPGAAEKHFHLRVESSLVCPEGHEWQIDPSDLTAIRVREA